MRITVLFLSLVLASFCWANPMIITDTMYKTYVNSGSCGSGGSDVVGDVCNYDIQSATMSVDTVNNQATVTLLFNYAFDSNIGTNWASLGQYTDNAVSGLLLNVGDLFFYDPSNPGSAYGLSLTGHDSYTAAGTYTGGLPKYTDNGSTNPIAAGKLYNLGTYTNIAVNTLTNQQALDAVNQKGVTAGMGASTFVYINGGSLAKAGEGSGSITVTEADGTKPTLMNKPELKVVVTFDTSGAIALFDSGKIGFQFSSADCSNDVITGTFAAPEPSTIFLAAGGLLLAGAGLLRRKRAA